MKPINPTAAQPSAFDRLEAAVPVARRVSLGLGADDDRRVPIGWTQTTSAPDWVLLLGAQPNLDALPAGLASHTASADHGEHGAPERIWVVAPNPAGTEQVLALLRGEPAALDPHLVPALDAAFAAAGWLPDVGKPPQLRAAPADTAVGSAASAGASGESGRSGVRGGLGSLLDQLADASGLGGADPDLVRCYRRWPVATLAHPAGGSTAPFLSVLVRTQGAGLRQQTLRDTLLCLAAQTDLDLEVLVLAHRVGEPERDILVGLLEDYEQLLPGRLRLVEVEQPGRSTPLTTGARVARGRYLAVLDDDDTVLGHWVSSFRELADRAGRPAVLRCRCVSQRIELTDSSAGYRAWTRFDAPWAARFDLLDQVTDNHMPIHSYALPRAELAAWGLTWDSELPVLEDWDLLMRAVNVLGVVDGEQFTSVYRLWPPTQNSQALTSADRWVEVRENLLSRWDGLSWIAPPGTIDHAKRAEFALLAARPLGDKVRQRVQRLARRAGPTLLATPAGRVARTMYRRSGLRPRDPD
ncbi:MAG TPA: glycosyltransferase family A protein [Dermatophilaceae bacterium]|nr:glycosyltransferase family A protein [Dermatophilaceae bacterium]